MATIDREIFFDAVRPNPFPNSLNQDQVNGMEAILDAWESDYSFWDLRWLAYMLATTYHETSAEMLPIEEYGRGEGMEYGKKDPETGQTYYGRGYVQLTWRENYAKADKEIGLTGNDSCEWGADNALDPEFAAEIAFVGMRDGWFRSDEEGRETLQRYFNDTRDDPYGAREIINGDKTKVPSWSNGVSIGHLIADYHKHFLDALHQAYIEDAQVPTPTPSEEVTRRVTITIKRSADVLVDIVWEDME